MKISNVEISELLFVIEELLNNRFNRKCPTNQTNDLATLHSYENLRDEADFKSIDLSIILMWKMNKHSVKSIAIKTWMDQNLINKNISKCKLEVLNLWKINKTKIGR